MSIWGAFFALFLFLLFFSGGLHGSYDSRRLFVKLSGLPDAPFVTEARYIRHRSLTGLYPVFDFSPESGEVFPFSFIYGSPASYRGSELKIKYKRD